MTERTLTGRSALITGATGGLGFALAKAFWRAGASLALAGREASRLDALHRELMKDGPADGRTLVALQADLGLADAARTLVREAETRLGGLTVLVNAAALQGPIGPAWENDATGWERTLQVNLLAPFHLCGAVLPGMLARGYGKILNVSGGGAAASRPNFSAYATSKAGLVRFTEVLADETKGKGVDVNAIAPGPMRTRMLDEILSAGPEKVGPEYALARQRADADDASPERAVGLGVFLASAASDGITGRLISAIWDGWEELPRQWKSIEATDVYTLRRIVPEDRRSGR